jgi:hypothetical protein
VANLTSLLRFAHCNTFCENPTAEIYENRLNHTFETHLTLVGGRHARGIEFVSVPPMMAGTRRMKPPARKATCAILTGSSETGLELTRKIC